VKMNLPHFDSSSFVPGTGQETEVVGLEIGEVVRGTGAAGQDIEAVDRGTLFVDQNTHSADLKNCHF
jgi:hypothetical protein